MHVHIKQETHSLQYLLKLVCSIMKQLCCDQKTYTTEQINQHYEQTVYNEKPYHGEIYI